MTAHLKFAPRPWSGRTVSGSGREAGDDTFARNLFPILIESPLHRNYKYSIK
jgi:hypothetical protein